MSGVKIELDDAGILALLQSAEIAAVCQAEAERMTAATGVDYIPKMKVTEERVMIKGLDTAENAQNFEDENKAFRAENGIRRYRRKKK